MNQILENREMSGFPVSIGTGLALESLFNPTQSVIDPDRKFDKVKDIKRYDLFLFNVETLIRNITSSISSDDLAFVKDEDIYLTLEDEIDFLKYLFEEENLDVKFFYNDCSFYKDSYPNDIRKPSTVKQLRYESIVKHCIKRLTKEHKDVKIFSMYPRYEGNRSALILTRYVVDLLGFDKFRLLDLLESHTGSVKTRKDYNSKYYPIPREDMSTLPLYLSLLVKFGDKVIFKPRSMKERLETFKHLKDMRVNPLTSEYSLALKLKIK